MSWVHAITLAHVDASDVDAHKTKLLCPFRNRDLLHQLMVCTQRFAQWFGGMDSPCVHYQDFAKWAWLCAAIDPDLDSVEWVNGYSDALGLERAFEPSFHHVEKKAYDTLAEWTHALRVATDKVSEAERPKQIIRRSDITTAKESRDGDLVVMPYEKLTYGSMREAGAQNEIVSFLEGYADGRRMYSESLDVLEYVFDACVVKGTCRATPTPTRRRGSPC